MAAKHWKYNMELSQEMAAIFAIANFGALVCWLLTVAVRRRAGAPIVDEDDDAQVEDAIRYLERPRRVAGNRWVAYKCELVTCEPPREHGTITIGGGPAQKQQKVRSV